LTGEGKQRRLCEERSKPVGLTGEKGKVDCDVKKLSPYGNKMGKNA